MFCSHAAGACENEMVPKSYSFSKLNRVDLVFDSGTYAGVRQSFVILFKYPKETGLSKRL